jgi:serine phosphatase RsbU (regulator of sigma subunit)
MYPTSEGQWRVVIGDVCGAGPEAAAVTGIARYTLRATAGNDPANALGTLNASILEHTRDNRFLTAVCLSLQAGPAGVEARMCCAGHPSPLVVRADGRVEEAARHGSSLLGVFDDPLLADVSITLAPGDALVLYTDGVTEARDEAGVQFGEEGLVSLLASCAGRTADGIARRVELAARDHLGGSQHDDIAIVVLRATGGP